jgi:hypothetical protein
MSGLGRGNFLRAALYGRDQRQQCLAIPPHNQQNNENSRSSGKLTGFVQIRKSKILKQKYS